MKKIFFGTLAVASLLLSLNSCNSTGGTRVAITLDGVEDSLSYAYINVAAQSDREALVEGIAGKDQDGAGKNTYIIPVPDDNNTYLVMARLKGSSPVVSGQQFRFFIFPGETIRVKGKFDEKTEMLDYEFSGSPVFEAESKHRKEKYENLQMELEIMSSSFSLVADSTRERMIPRLQEISDSINLLKKEYILSHPNEMLAGYYLLSIPNAKLSDSLYHEVLSDKVKKGAMKGLLDTHMQRVEGMLATEKAKEAVVEGAAAPDFTLKTTEGKDFKLSSLYGQGKYVVLDFWGMWCGWCLKGFPEMKTVYEKYAPTGKIEFVGINCGDTETVWKDGVKEQGLPWINVYNGKEMNGGAPVEYGVQGFPTKIIIAPDGTIAARFVGETPDFYTKLEELVAGK